MNELITDEKIIGLRLKTNHPDAALEFVEEAIPKETLVEMTRRRLRPMLSREEIEARGKNFTLVSGFATIFDFD